jgi:uncharacterized protein (UPF0332 family)
MMALHDDLLAEAKRMLAYASPPAEVTLRRAISTAYYAVFHLLLHECVRATVQAHAFEYVERSVEHKTIREKCEQWINRKYDKFVQGKLSGGGVEPELLTVFDAFMQLHAAREDADYNMTKAANEPDAKSKVALAVTAFQEWNKVRSTDNAKLFLTVVLFEKVRRKQ